MMSTVRTFSCVICAAFMAQIANAQNPLPADAKATCVVTPAQFAAWFQSGTVTPNGVVKPANSLNFAPNSLCSFDQWSAQMFLWLTSPASAYGANARVFDSAVFYDVEIVGKNRILIPNNPIGPNQVRRIKNFSVRSAQVGPNGKLLAVSATGAVSNVETGQAGGNGTLMSQQGSLVYYSTHVNDVYAYFLTGTRTTKNPITPTPTAFPTTATQLKQITDFATQQLQKQVLDPTALAMELKISWVDAAAVPNADVNYVTITAIVPTFDFSVPPVSGVWAEGPPMQKKLAMVGMHVVGSVAGHPEMIWATFEHANNAPNGGYSYLNTAGTVVNVPLTAAGNWLFCANNAPAPFNQETLKSVAAATGPPPTPAGISPFVAGAMKAVPSNTLRTFPWGGASGNAGIQNNTDMISLNNAIISMLGNSDIRKNYVLIGAVWTGGQVPPAPGGQTPPTTGTPPVSITAQQTPIGSVLLSNATMETYHQVIANPQQYNPAFGMNCFNCHNNGNLGGLSHIWNSLQPLPQK